jgi:hypothetical protein
MGAQKKENGAYDTGCDSGPCQDIFSLKIKMGERETI